ncbi:hypothetical protein RhiirC2_717135 [Rhizophagus irregularis]|uniref:DUF6570 domain-containing protein n=1 Tax=Rhizophagus irregularis TaxID=588596 RepID=A0A2N1MNK2_9GLOM|nr:hypothetical protein RhiirC2_717135 [Rhizophagus irregularis]
MPNKFSAENNMDLGEVSEELRDLTEIEEMLIARTFTVMSVYRLRAFRDFTVRRAKVTRALQWLKANNQYYADIIIDEEALQSLPENCSIADHLPQIENDQLNEDSSEDENGNDNMITRTFVPYLPPSHCEDHAIKSTLNRIQT